MIVGNISELSLVDVLDRGVPNKESIAISVHANVNLGQFGIILGSFSQTGMAVPFRDNLFWFGDGLVRAGDWIFVDTGEGHPTQSKNHNDDGIIYTVFWNKQKTLFARSNVVPILFRVDSVDIPDPPEDVPQGPRLENHTVK